MYTEGRKLHVIQLLGRAASESRVSGNRESYLRAAFHRDDDVAITEDGRFRAIGQSVHATHEG